LRALLLLLLLRCCCCCTPGGLQNQKRCKAMWRCRRARACAPATALLAARAAILTLQQVAACARSRPRLCRALRAARVDSNSPGLGRVTDGGCGAEWLLEALLPDVPLAARSRGRAYERGTLHTDPTDQRSAAPAKQSASASGQGAGPATTWSHGRRRALAKGSACWTHGRSRGTGLVRRGCY
jgi:hypothetical protein